MAGGWLPTSDGGSILLLLLQLNLGCSGLRVGRPLNPPGGDQLLASQHCSSHVPARPPPWGGQRGWGPCPVGLRAMSMTSPAGRSVPPRRAVSHRITDPQNGRGWKGPLGII